VNYPSNIKLTAASLGVALIVTAMLPMGAASAQSAPSLDGAYKGTLVCPLSGQAVLRVPLDMTIADNSVQFSRPILDRSGRVLESEMGTGMIEGSTLHLKSSGHSGHRRYEGSYNGEITPDGGVLTGTQAWTVSTVTRTRRCSAAFVKLRT
jgi:hypothetical protein